MKSNNKKPIYIMLYSVLILQFICYVQKLLKYLHIPFAAVLSKLIIYGGSVQLVIVLAVLYWIKKKRIVSREELKHDKKFQFLGYTSVLLMAGMSFI